MSQNLFEQAVQLRGRLLTQLYSWVSQTVNSLMCSLDNDVCLMFLPCHGAFGWVTGGARGV